MAQTLSNIKIEPVKITYGEDVMQTEEITCVADSAGSLNNKYFVFYTTGGVKHYIWLNINSAGTDPALSGATGHEVTAATGASATTIATAIADVATAVTGFDATSDGAVVTLVATTAGYAKPAHEGAAATGFTFKTIKYGDVAAELGFCDGDIGLSMESKMIDVTSHQTGDDIITAINTGNNVSITATLKEVSVAQLRKMFIANGDSMIPSGTGASSTEVFGWGSSQQFSQIADRCKKLNLHPQVLPSSNLSRDVTAWKAFPIISELNFSGENLLMLPVEFRIFPDFTKNSKINKVVYGDATQTLT